MGIEFEEDELWRSVGVLGYNLITLEQGYHHNCPISCVPTKAVSSSARGFYFCAVTNKSHSSFIASDCSVFAYLMLLKKRILIMLPITNSHALGQS